MQKGLKLHTTSFVIRVLLVGFLGLSRGVANADLVDGHSFRPIAWESDFTDQSALSFTAYRLSPGAQLVPSTGASVASAFGLKLAQKLRDYWTGRIGLFCGRSSDVADDFIWSFLGSDLAHPLIPESLYGHPVFSRVRPHIYFGFGMTSRWADPRLGLNLVPTLRYETTEPATYAGVELFTPIAEELLLSVDYRFVQSARISKNRGHMFGLALVWGKLEKK